MSEVQVNMEINSGEHSIKLFKRVYQCNSYSIKLHLYFANKYVSSNKSMHNIIRTWPFVLKVPTQHCILFPSPLPQKALWRKKKSWGP